MLFNGNCGLKRCERNTNRRGSFTQPGAVMGLGKIKNKIDAPLPEYRTASVLNKRKLLNGS